MTILNTKTTLNKQEVDLLLKIREGAVRIFSIARNPIQRLDVAKTLLVNNMRLFACLRQLQQENVLEANAATASPTSEQKSFDSLSSYPLLYKAKLCLSGIRIPLIWREVPSFTNVSFLNSTMTLNRLCDLNLQSNELSSNPFSVVRFTEDGGSYNSSELSPKSYAVFCVIQVGSKIQETRLLFDILPGTSDIEFDDVLTFNNVTPDFRCTIEVYAYPRSPKSGNNSSFLRRKDIEAPFGAPEVNDPEQATICQPHGFWTNSSSCFALVGRYVADLRDADGSLKAHSLDVGDHAFSSARSDVSSMLLEQNQAQDSNLAVGGFFDASCDIPLFGPICFSLVAQPYSMQDSIADGYLWIKTLSLAFEQEPVQLYFCQLKNQRLYGRLAKMLSANVQNLSLDVNKFDRDTKKLEEIKKVSTCDGESTWDLILIIDQSTKILDMQALKRKVIIKPEDVRLVYAKDFQIIDSPSTTLNLNGQNNFSQYQVKKLIDKISSPLGVDSNPNDALPTGTENSPQTPSEESYLIQDPRLYSVCTEAECEAFHVSTISTRESVCVASPDDYHQDTLSGHLNGDRKMNVNPPPSDRQIENATENNISLNLSDMNGSNVAILDLFTFRIATLDISSETSPRVSSIHNSDLSVFELADVKDSDSFLKSYWLAAIRKHLDEQALWGETVFSQTTRIPEATSLVKHGSISRASKLFDTDLPWFDSNHGSGEMGPYSST